LDTLYEVPTVYFVTACTEHRRPLLADAGVHEVVVAYARDASLRRIWVGRYVLMPDHMHLFACFGQGALRLSEWMKRLKAVIARYVKSTQIAGPCWQKGFFDHVLRSSESYERKWIYVRENPVRAGLVRTWSDWPYQGEINPLSL
jgi:REP element-mobilizing transposase RayT